FRSHPDRPRVGDPSNAMARAEASGASASRATRRMLAFSTIRRLQEHDLATSARMRGAKRMQVTRRATLALGAGMTLSIALRPARAATGYPEHPVRVYVPAAAGTGLDVDARAIMAKFSDELRQPVVIVNQPQAS